MPMVSVIIPTYNRLPILLDAVNSVLSQQFTDLELIIVDDGSTDGTRQVIQAIQDPRIRYLYKENGGVASARNLGLDSASGKYLFNLDSDDYWLPEFLVIMVPVMEAHLEYSAFYGKRIVLFPDGTLKEDVLVQSPRCGKITRELFLHKSLAPVHTSGTGFRRSDLEGVRYDERLRNSADFDYWLRLSVKIQFLFVPQAAFVYRAQHTVNPRTSFSRENGNRIRILERFFFELDGRRFISPMQAYRKISHSYCSVGKTHLDRKNRAIALFMMKHAIGYWPLDFRLYYYWIKALLVSKKEDALQEWEMPPPLSKI
jgi:glycosyltransferase involved in cell wall biosynthesis